MAKEKSVVDWIALVLVIVGALNWGLIAINANWNLVSLLFGNWALIERIVYALVGLSGLWAIKIAAE
jgi:uncharacterized membrane protein YuzA (DUF378 family)